MPDANQKGASRFMESWDSVPDSDVRGARAPAQAMLAMRMVRHRRPFGQHSVSMYTDAVACKGAHKGKFAWSATVVATTATEF
eukprot:10566724-Alexandrium_andersonii.AAC.1